MGVASALFMATVQGGGGGSLLPTPPGAGGPALGKALPASRKSL